MEPLAETKPHKDCCMPLGVYLHSLCKEVDVPFLDRALSFLADIYVKDTTIVLDSTYGITEDHLIWGAEWLKHSDSVLAGNPLVSQLTVSDAGARDFLKSLVLLASLARTEAHVKLMNGVSQGSLCSASPLNPKGAAECAGGTTVPENKLADMLIEIRSLHSMDADDTFFALTAISQQATQRIVDVRQKLMTQPLTKEGTVPDMTEEFFISNLHQVCRNASGTGSQGTMMGRLVKAMSGSPGPEAECIWETLGAYAVESLSTQLLEQVDMGLMLEAPQCKLKENEKTTIRDLLLYRAYPPDDA